VSEGADLIIYWTELKAFDLNCEWACSAKCLYFCVYCTKNGISIFEEPL